MLSIKVHHVAQTDTVITVTYLVIQGAKRLFAGEVEFDKTIFNDKDKHEKMAYIEKELAKILKKYKDDADVDINDLIGLHLTEEGIITQPSTEGIVPHMP